MWGQEDITALQRLELTRKIVHLLLSSLKGGNVSVLEGGMALGRFDIQHRTAYAGNPSGFYYWTNSFYLDVPDPAHAGPSISHIFEGYEVVNYHAVQRNWIRLAVPPGHTPYIFDSFAFNDPGNSVLTDPFIIEDIARVHFYVGEDYVGYKLLRGTVGVSEIEDGYLTDSCRSRIEDNLSFYWFQNDLRTHDNRVITSLRCDPKAHAWNLRHGTKRRQRGVIHNP